MNPYMYNAIKQALPAAKARTATPNDAKRLARAIHQRFKWPRRQVQQCIENHIKESLRNAANKRALFNQGYRARVLNDQRVGDQAVLLAGHVYDTHKVDGDQVAVWTHDGHAYNQMMAQPFWVSIDDVEPTS